MAAVVVLLVLLYYTKSRTRFMLDDVKLCFRKFLY